MNQQVATFLSSQNPETVSDVRDMMETVEMAANFHYVTPYKVIRILQAKPLETVTSVQNVFELDQLIIAGLYAGEAREERLADSKRRAEATIDAYGEDGIPSAQSFRNFPALVQLMDADDSEGWREAA